METRDQRIYVQYGCRFVAPEEWINFDASPTLMWEKLPVIGKLYTKNEARFPLNVRCGDIVKGLPVADGTCQGIYASHVLEHLALDDFRVALRNTLRMMRPEGIFRLVVPDLEWCAREYLTKLESGDGAANTFFLSETRLGMESRSHNPVAFLREWLGNARHMWMWDANSLIHELRSRGFTRIRRCCFADCADPMFALVEEESRFEHAVAIEARW